jgi:hypothetical protein
MGAPQLWVMIGSMVFLGGGIVMAATHTRLNRAAGDVTVVQDTDRI